MNKLVEFDGQRHLPEAVELIASDTPPDLVVVRGLITDTNLLNSLGSDVTPSEKVADHTALREAIPQFEKANKIISERWANIGYVDYSSVSNATFDLLIDQEAIEPHIDPVPSSRNRVEAIAQASLCITGSRNYMAEVLPQTFKTSEGELDVYNWDSFADFDSGFSTTLKTLKHQPRTQTEVNAGDLALFPHHPVVTLHSIKHEVGKRSVARLINWFATTK